MFFTAVIILAIIGLLNTTYLSWHAITKKPVACIGFPKEWCEKVQYSKYSKTLGIPNGMAGFVIYSLVLAFTLLYQNGTLSQWPLAGVITVGFLFSTYFLYIQGAVLKAFCTWCVLSAIEFSLLFILLIVHLVG